MARKLFNATLSLIDKRFKSGELIKTLANDALVEVIDRTQQSGKDVNDNKFPGYSTNPGYFRLKDRKSKRFEGGYKAFRNANSRRTDIVNLTFAGRMMNNLKVKRASRREAIIGFTQKRQQEKADNTSRLKGTWVGLSPRQVKKLSNRFGVELRGLIARGSRRIEIR